MSHYNCYYFNIKVFSCCCFLFSLLLLCLFRCFFSPAGRVKQSLCALPGFIGSSPNPQDKHFAATRPPRICNLQLLSLPWQQIQVRRTGLSNFGRTCFHSRDVTAKFQKGLRWSVSEGNKAGFLLGFGFLFNTYQLCLTTPLRRQMCFLFPY